MNFLFIDDNKVQLMVLKKALGLASYAAMEAFVRYHF